MSTRILIGKGVALAIVATHSAVRLGAFGTHNINLVDKHITFGDTGATTKYYSIKHTRGIFYDKLSYWRDGYECYHHNDTLSYWNNERYIPFTRKTWKPMEIIHTNLDGSNEIIPPNKRIPNI